MKNLFATLVLLTASLAQAELSSVSVRAAIFEAGQEGIWSNKDDKSKIMLASGSAEAISENDRYKVYCELTMKSQDTQGDSHGELVITIADKTQGVPYKLVSTTSSITINKNTPTPIRQLSTKIQYNLFSCELGAD